MFDSSRILVLRGGVLRPIGNFRESLSQAILVGIIIVGRLGVHMSRACTHVCTQAFKHVCAYVGTLTEV